MLQPSPNWPAIAFELVSALFAMNEWRLLGSQATCTNGHKWVSPAELLRAACDQNLPFSHVAANVRICQKPRSNDEFFSARGRTDIGTFMPDGF